MAHQMSRPRDLADNPRYDGGSWHVQGMANEINVVTGIYYYHAKNVTESRPNFQIQMTESDYEKDAKREMWHMYELYDGDATVQHLEGIITKQDQCIIFLSIFQHLAQPFELQGSSQPGSRKILVSYLVNPEEDRITSTILLLPQLADWYPTVEILREVEPRLPQELVTMIVIDWTQTRGLCN